MREGNEMYGHWSMVRDNPGKVYVGVSRWGHLRYYTWGVGKMWALETDAPEGANFTPSVLPESELERMVFRPIEDYMRGRRDRAQQEVEHG